MPSPRKHRIAARIFPPPIPPRTNSTSSQPLSSNLNIESTTTRTAIDPKTIQEPAPAAVPSHRRSHACYAPIVWNEREEKSRREKTEESEKARDDLLELGIKVRDFQVEFDERKVAETNGSR